MAMNFYRQQEESRRKARLLSVLFLAAGFFCALILSHVLNWMISLLLLGINAYFHLNIEQSSYMQMILMTAILLSIFTASALKLRRLSDIRYVVMQSKAVRLDKAQTLSEQQLRNTVEETAIAAGVAVPVIYVMRKEPAVNVFAYGMRSGYMMIIITEGCLKNLNREELQGIAAYAMAQILSGYARLNTFMHGLLFGLDCVYIAAQKILAASIKPKKKNDDDENNINEEGSSAGVFFLFLPLFIVSGLGYCAASLIKSAVCRQNVFETDATAVQLLHQTEGLAGVLQKSISTSFSYLIFSDAFVFDFGHMFFTYARHPIYTFSVFHAHPKPEERIRKLLPDRDGSLPENKQQKNSSQYDENAAAFALGIVGSMHELAMQKETDCFWTDCARQPENSVAVLFAVLMKENQNAPETMRIIQNYDSQLIPKIQTLHRHKLPENKRFAVLAITLPNLRLHIIGKENIQKLKTTTHKIINSDKHISLFEHCVYAALSGCLKDDIYQSFRPTATQEKLSSSVNLLLMMCAQNSNEGKYAQETFRAACTYCQLNPAPYQENLSLSMLPEIILRVQNLNDKDKNRLLQAMKIIATHDKQISENEHNWLAAMRLILSA